MQFDRFRFVAAGLLLAIAGAASAQQQQQVDDPGELLRAARDVMRQIDEDRTAALWDASPGFVQSKFPKVTYVDNMRNARGTVGSVSGREWSSVARVPHVGSTEAPAGTYANVVFLTRTTSGKSHTERLSFKLEAGSWRFTGYTPVANAP